MHFIPTSFSVSTQFLDQHKNFLQSFEMSINIKKFKSNEGKINLRANL